MSGDHDDWSDYESPKPKTDLVLEYMVFVLGVATVLCGTVLILFMSGYLIAWMLS